MRVHIGMVTAVLVLLGAGDVQATLTLEGSGPGYSKVVDEIEYYLELDKSVYEQGENVEMLYRVTNLKEQDVTFLFSSTLQRNFWVDKNGTNIWRASHLGYTIPTEFTLASGENKKFTYTWDMKINQNELLDIGNYMALGGLYDFPGEYDFTKVGVDIEIVPEPLSVTIVLFGFIGIMIKRKRVCM